MPDPIRLSQDDLYNEEVDEIVNEQRALQRSMPSLKPTPL